MDRLSLNREQRRKLLNQYPILRTQPEPEQKKQVDPQYISDEEIFEFFDAYESAILKGEAEEKERLRSVLFQMAVEKCYWLMLH